ncbi:MAG: GHMP kinase [Armatimonadetes bacterium]|nr:GHMP kinase [Armatimonadota bacterium]MDW8028651.1 galactokinase family protein [Armatimonadota bacterium]
MAKWVAKAPGRLCLFGEHQDYLGLPVIATAISLFIQMEAEKRNDQIVFVNMPDIGETETIDLSEPIVYERPRQYLRSGLKVLQDLGYNLSHGLTVTVRGEIPINAGTASSSAFVIAWLKLLLRICQASEADEPETLARLGHKAEVVEFGEPGGMMDHFAASFGGTIFVDTRPPFRAELLSVQLDGFVLGDTLQRKETLEVLRQAKEQALEAFKQIQFNHPDFNIHTTPKEIALAYAKELPEPLRSKVIAHIHNRDLCKEAKEMLSSGEVKTERLGEMLTEHHRWLRVLGVSTPKLDELVEAALNAGAMGAKLNGSGGGGCMFAYAPGKQHEVAEAIERARGKAFIVSVAQGACAQIL